jgi:hypothetical protein
MKTKRCAVAAGLAMLASSAQAAIDDIANFRSPLQLAGPMIGVRRQRSFDRHNL